MNLIADNYFTDGCGRCEFGGTPDCKVHKWAEELAILRAVVLDCGLTEACKWGVPCYTFQNGNVVLLSAFKDYCALSFFKGSLLEDADGLLVQQTENVQAGRQLRFTQVQEIKEMKPAIEAYLFEAMEVEKAGLKVAFKTTDEFDWPEELQKKMDENPAFKAAFEALTSGRQRGYVLHFSAPKQSGTRESRIEKSMELIFNGKGLHDEYHSRRK